MSVCIPDKPSLTVLTDAMRHYIVIYTNGREINTVYSIHATFTLLLYTILVECNDGAVQFSRIVLTSFAVCIGYVLVEFMNY